MYKWPLQGHELFMLLDAWANLNEKNGLEDFQGGEENCNYWAREFEGLNICLLQW